MKIEMRMASLDLAQTFQSGMQEQVREEDFAQLVSQQQSQARHQAAQRYLAPTLAVRPRNGATTSLTAQAVRIARSLSSGGTAKR